MHVVVKMKVQHFVSTRSIHVASPSSSGGRSVWWVGETGEGEALPTQCRKINMKCFLMVRLVWHGRASQPTRNSKMVALAIGQTGERWK